MTTTAPEAQDDVAMLNALLDRLPRARINADGEVFVNGRDHPWRTDPLVPLSAVRAALSDRLASAVAADELRGLDTPERVRFYEHDFYVLSNFSAFGIEWEGRWFPTSEHAYHWEKFYDGDPRANSPIAYQVMNAPSAHEAFKIAERNRAHRRPDWDDVKVDIMRGILRAKTEQHEYVRRKLLATGDRELVEDSWRDDYWGWGPNRDGQNMLGKLWMEVRAELRAEGAAP